MDRYARFARSDVGGRVAGLLGLPQPARLRRHTPGDPLVDGVALVTGPGSSHLRELAVDVLVGDGIEVHEQPDDVGTVYAAVVVDATELADSAALRDVYLAAQAGVRRLADAARVVVLGVPSEVLDDPRARTGQRALVGLVRSVAKELDGGSTANLLLVEPAAVGGASRPLRFLLSGRSAYVSGQSLVVGPASEVLPVAPRDERQPLTGRVAVVTGAARGIGAAIAHVLSRDGATVVCVDLPAAGEQLAATANAVGGTSLPLDVTSADAPQVLVEHLVQRFGGVDVVVNNAGVTRDKTLKGMDDQRWDLVLGVNLLAVEHLDEHLLASGALRDQPRIVCLSSAIGGIAGNRGQTNYGTSKAGIIGHVEALAHSLADRGGTINAVAPGFIETAMTSQMPLAPREVGRRLSALGQGGLPVDVAEAVAFLATTDATWVNGRTLRVCGLNLLGA